MSCLLLPQAPRGSSRRTWSRGTACESPSTFLGMQRSGFACWPRTTSSSSGTWGSSRCRLKVKDVRMQVWTHTGPPLTGLVSLCLGEGAINVAVGPNRGQEVRVNGPIGAPGQMRMDVNFPGQPGPGICQHKHLFL